MKTGLLKIDLQNINFFSKIQDGVLVDVTFDSLLLFSTILILRKELILLSELEDKGVEFLIVNLDSFEVEDLSLERVDDDVFLIIFFTSQVVGPDSSFSVVKVFAVHAD